jgi:hypothetical protein
VNTKTVNPVLSEANQNGSVTVLDNNNVDPDATVSMSEQLTVAETIETTHTITGDVATSDTTVSADPLRISVTAAESPVERYDTDGNGNIDIIELGQAGQDFASGELTITELGEVGQAFAS